MKKCIRASGSMFHLTFKLLTLLFLFFLFTCKPEKALTPEWAADLVIYEIAVKGFTSPDGPESGTFNSLKDKLGYLEKLGINAIWLTGHSLADPDHFYGIWTQYACIEPDKIDPSLGTEQEFKDLINEAHNRGIRIFLDTIEHGVMSYSPLVKQHPDWFKDGTWGMTDYDWQGDHPELEEWWVDMWTKAVLEWGVDGFRCDCGLHRPDLWLEVKRRCAAAGKPIFILGESGIENVSDACQRDVMLFNQRMGRLDNLTVLNNLASVRDLLHEELNWNTVKITAEILYADSSQMLDKSRGGVLEVTFQGSGEDVIGTWDAEPDGMKDWNWMIRGVDPDRPITNIILACPERNWEWQSNGWGWKLAVNRMEDGLLLSGGNPLPGPKLRVISPSCHDCGWDGFPKEKNPYTVQGSRHVMGYGVLLAPAIPIIMSGAEFDAEYVPLPNHTPDLYGKGEKGAGRWLYGSWLQWEQLNMERHSAMLRDSKRLLTIRRNHRDLIHAVPVEQSDIQVIEVPAVHDQNLPVPYILTNSTRALLVAGNPSQSDINVSMEITHKRLGFSADIKSVQLTELWPVEQESRVISIEELSDYQCSVPADYLSGGGLQVLRFEPVL